MKLCPLEVFAAGVRIGSKAPAILTDDLFTHGNIWKLFDGDSATRTAKLVEWLKGQGVEWDGKQDSLIQTVADALRSRNELEAARKLLAKVTMQLSYTNLSGPSPLKAVIEALLLMPQVASGGVCDESRKETK